MKYMVAIPVPEPASSLVANLKTQLRPPGWHDTMPPHITLLSPDTPTLDVDDAASTFSRMRLAMPAAPIHASKIGRFDRAGRHTIILLASPRIWLSNLQQAVLTRSNWQSTASTRKHNFEPHITLVNQTTLEGAAQAANTIIQAAIRVEFICRNINLYCKGSHWPRWRVLSTKRLNKTSEI